jgi:hypothetical protein
LLTAISRRPKRYDRLDHGLDVLRLRHIAADEERVAARGLDRRDGLIADLFIEIDDRDIRAGLRKRGCCGPTDAHGPARYQRLFATQIE